MRVPKRGGVGPRILTGLAVGLLFIGTPLSLGLNYYYRPTSDAAFSWAWRHAALPIAAILVGAVAIRPRFWFDTRPTLSAPRGPGVVGPLLMLGVIWFLALGAVAGGALWVNANVGRVTPVGITGPVVRRWTASRGRGGRTYLVDLPIDASGVVSVRLLRATWDSTAVGARLDVVLYRGSLGMIFRPR